MNAKIMERKNSFEAKGIGLRRIIHRAMTYPLLAPVILAYMSTKDARMLDLFYSVRSMPHGFPMRNDLRLAKFNGNKMIFPSREDPNFDDVWLRDVYFPYIPRSGHTVIDVGAHMGFFTVKMAKQVKEVIAFEPELYSFKFLSMNIRYNGLSNVRAFNYALGERNKNMFLRRSYGYGRTRVTETNTGHRVRVKSLDSIVEELEVVPDVVKVDTEGYEMKVLEGAKSTLTRYKPKLIIASYHYRDEWKDLVNYLVGIGFQCFIYYIPHVLQRTKEAYIYSEPSRCQQNT